MKIRFSRPEWWLATFSLGTAALIFTGLCLHNGDQAHAQTKGEVRAGLPGQSFADIVERVAPSVVAVHSERFVSMQRPEFQFPFGGDSPFDWFFRRPDQPERQPQPQPRRQPREYRFSQRGIGSGIIVDTEGHILTNNHVVDGVDEIKVTLADKRTFTVKVIGSDPQTDLAVLKITDKITTPLPVAQLGDSDAMRVGDWVLAIGAPFGYQQTVTFGIVSAKGRGDVGVTDYEDFIQTDAAINPGNSGGPLINMNGDVIGINTAIATRVGQYAGVGFAIPINMIQKIMPSLIKGESVRRGLLGVIIQDINADMAKQFGLPDTRGALVAQVNSGSAAEKAGVKVGDVIVRYGGKPVDDFRQLRNMVAGTKPGEKIEIVVIRDGRERKLTVQVGELTAEAAASASAEPAKSDVALLGLKIEALTPARAKQLGYEGESGLIISEIKDDSPAAAAGLQPGDLIVEANRKRVTTAKELDEAVKESKERGSVLMLIKREGSSRFVIVKTG